MQKLFVNKKIEAKMPVLKQNLNFKKTLGIKIQE
jgi:hypothetical protein